MNQNLLDERRKAQQDHEKFILENTQQIKSIDAENEDTRVKIDLLYSRLKEKKNFLEKSFFNRRFEYNEYCDKKFEVCKDKNQDELSNLERKLLRTLNSYIDASGKRLFEFNAAVQGDLTDLTTVPIDMKEYDQNPLKKVVFIPENANRKVVYN